MQNNAIDSTQETLAHIRRVQGILAEVQERLMSRAIVHDKSKLEEPEKTYFDTANNALRGLTYGSEEYKAQLVLLKPALDHHYAFNSHHPESHSAGISGMSLLDLIEMACDWKAATERHANGDITRSININQERFGISDQLTRILHNTAVEMQWAPAT